MTPNVPRCTYLGRDRFNTEALSRDQHRCVACGNKGTAAGGSAKLDVHHIIDRKLWDNGGYYVENAATLCETCHMQAESTLLSCETLREKAGIKITLLPEHFAQNEGERYDKWGNQILPTGQRLKGELFFDTGCQRMMQAAGLLTSFAKYVKYPRTMHLPWSPNLQNDDRRIESLKGFEGQEVIVTEKRDGESTSFYSDYLHARSVDSKDHPSRAIVRQLHGAFKHEIPEGWRICAENLYAQHSIAYDNLTAFFEVFNIWDEKNTCLSWDDTVAYCAMIGVGVGPGFDRGLPLVPILYRGLWDEAKIREIDAQIDTDKIEGYVVRVTSPIQLSEWRKKAAKFVRAKHVRTSEHWMRTWKPNQLSHA